MALLALSKLVGQVGNTVDVLAHAVNLLLNLMEHVRSSFYNFSYYSQPCQRY
jgi:hypothetical protein